MKKRGQVTIFIIIGIVIISTIVFLFKIGIIPELGEKSEKNPNAFLESCMEDKIKEAIEIISLQGGYIENPLHIAFKFEDEKSPINISYLCYNHNDYALCINQEPMLIQHLKDEIKNYISEEVDNCFNNKLTSSLEKQGYVVDAKYGGFEVELMEKKVVININAELTLTKSEETTKQEDFKIIVPSRFYDLAFVVHEIINEEATTGEFNQYSIFSYEDFDINKFKTSSAIIYSVKHEDSGEEFRFAVRGGVIPPGWFKFD